MLTETDAPYQSIESGMRNEPKYIPKLVEKIADIKGIDEKEAKSKIFENFELLFLKI